MAQLPTRSSRRHAARLHTGAPEHVPGLDLITSERQALTWVLETVRERVRLQGIDPVEAPEQAAGIIDSVLQDYDQASARAGLVSLVDLDAVRTEVMDAVAGFGLLQPLLDDNTVEEIWVNGPDQVFVARGGESELTGLRIDDEELRRLVERMLRRSGRRLDLSSPFVDAALPDKTVNAHPCRPETAGNELEELCSQLPRQVDRVATLGAGLVNVDDQDSGVLLVGQHRVLELA